MGDLAKRLGQLAARSLTSESAAILKNAAANKAGLSKALDATLRQAHDMRTFGLGTASSLASRERYLRFTTSMHHVYDTMEQELDASVSPPVQAVWRPFGDDLRRAPNLAADLDDAAADGTPPKHTASPMTAEYMRTIREAAASDNSDGGGRLLGHLYCRYFADLFGGQALGTPTKLALGLRSSPSHYDFSALIARYGGHRRDAIESIYEHLNAAGDMLDEAQRTRVVDETRIAFAKNVGVYAEEGRLWTDGARGISNVLVGWARNR